MKKTNLSWVGALLVFALLLWCTAATPGKIDDPSTYTCAVYSSALSLLPPVIAIVLALNTKEVYTSLLVGIATGALLYANGNLELALTTLFFNEDGGMVSKLSDPSNVGILVFLVMLGILVALMNKAGGSAAFGRWASTHIHSRAGAQFATLLLGVMIFVDDYFNCLTVGSVMRPVTDRQKVSRAKLAYLIDSTAAPVCIIAPVSSWAAAVTSSVPEGSGINGFTMFLRTIPYNYYALLTIVMSLFLIFTGTDYCSMKQHEDNARAGDLFTTADRPYGDDVDTEDDARGHVIDLVAPVLVLIAACILGLIYTGGFFEGVDFITAFSDCNASAGLVLGTSLFLPQAKATGLGVDTDPFEEIVSELVKEAAGLVGQPVPTDMDSRFRIIYHVGAGYAIPNAEDTPYIEELARQEGILLDPVYTGKAWAKFLTLVKEGYFDGQEHIAFVHTGGAAALFAMELG